MAGGVISIGPHLAWDESRLPRHLSERIAGADDLQAVALVQRIEPNNVAAIDALVALAASPRAAVAHAAQQRLNVWIFSAERREALDPSEVDAETAELACALSSGLVSCASQFGPAGRTWARQISRRLLDVVHLVPERQRVGLIRDCGLVLATADSDARDAGMRAVGPAAPPPAARRKAALAMSTPNRMLQLAMQPGPFGAEPPTGSELAVQSAPGLAPASSRLLEFDGPAVSAAGPGDETAGDPSIEREMQALGSGLAWRSRLDEHYARVAPQAIANQETLDVPSPEAAHALEQKLLTAPLAEVLAALASEDPFTAASAEAVLQKRGMSGVDLEIARRLDGANVEARLHLLNETSRRSDAKATAWLQHFALDEAAEVRLRALTLLATSRDEVVLRQVYARAIQDQDARIRSLAQRLDLTSPVAAW